jgi:hypothetical protein
MQQSKVKKRPLGKLRSSWYDSIKMDLIKKNRVLWTELTWFMIGTSGRLL